MTALTVVVAMDPHNNWDHQVFPIDTSTIRAQLSTIVEGIGVDALKQVCCQQLTSLNSQLKRSKHMS